MVRPICCPQSSVQTFGSGIAFGDIGSVLLPLVALQKPDVFQKNPTTFDDLNKLTIFQALSKNPKASQKNSDPKRSTPCGFQ